MEEKDIKERIKEKAHSLIMQYGVRSISMDDIAGGLGISKKTIYLYYADKDELVKVVISEIINHSQYLCESERKDSENAIDELYRAKRTVNDILKAMNPSLLFELQKYHPAAYLQFQRFRSEFLYNVILKNIVRGVEEGMYREDLKAELVSRLRVESLLVPFNPEFQSQTQFTVAEVQEELIELYLFSLVNAKGHKEVLKYKRKYQQ